MSQEFCSGSVWDGLRTVSCPIRAKVVVDGQAYCGVHDPAKTAGERAKSDAIFAVERVVDGARWDIAKIKAEAAEWAFAHRDANDLRAKRDAARQRLADAQAKLAELEGR
jgi:hypothetical protein